MTFCVVPEGLAAASAAVEALTASAGLMAVADGGSGVAIHRGRVQLCRRRACNGSGPRCPRVWAAPVSGWASRAPQLCRR